MTDHAAALIATQIDALNGDAPVGAVLDLATENTRPEVRAAVARWKQRHRPCIEGDDVAYLRPDDVAPTPALMGLCASCGRPADAHPYRHPFKTHTHPVGAR